MRIKLIRHIFDYPLSCDTFYSLIPSKALPQFLKDFPATLLCFDHFSSMKRCLMPVIQYGRNFIFGFKPVVQNQQHLNALAFTDCKRPPISDISDINHK